MHTAVAAAQMFRTSFARMCIVFGIIHFSAETSHSQVYLYVALMKEQVGQAKHQEQSYTTCINTLFNFSHKKKKRIICFF